MTKWPLLSKFETSEQRRSLGTNATHSIGIETKS